MAVKKTTSKKATTTATKKTATSRVARPVESSVKKDSIIHKATVETRRTDRCDCGESCNCNCEGSCNCGCGLKIVIFVLIVLNLLVVLFTYFQKNPRDLTVSSLGWIENTEKVVNDLYEDEDYIEIQTQQIEASLSDFWLD